MMDSVDLWSRARPFYYNMSNLDCNTPQGQVYIGTQMACLSRIEEKWNCKVAVTDSKSSADIDAIIIKDGVISIAAEIKSREMSLDELVTFGSYLITFEKLLKLRNVGMALAVPSILAVSLLKDNRIVYWKIAEASGNFVARMENMITQTKATCNGGLTDRYNSYLSLKDMKILL